MLKLSRPWLNKTLLLMLGAVNLYVLFYIILFKFSPVQLSTLTNQLRLVLEQPYLLESRLQHANFTPFYTIKSSLRMDMARIQWLNIYGNIFIFIPTGLLIAFLVNKRRISISILCSFIISLLLETMQLILSMGSFDVDDLILNTLGGLAGGIIGVSFLGARAVLFKR